MQRQGLTWNQSGLVVRGRRLTNGYFIRWERRSNSVETRVDGANGRGTLTGLKSRWGGHCHGGKAQAGGGAEELHFEKMIKS